MCVTVDPRSQNSSPAAPAAVCAAVSPAQSSAEQEGRTRIVEACCSQRMEALWSRTRPLSGDL